METCICRSIRLTTLTRRASITFLALLLTGCITIDILGGRRGRLQETVVEGERGPKIALIEIEGFLGEVEKPTRLGFGEQESSVARVRAELDMAGKDPAVKALVLRI